ncbi:WD40 repeat-like protein [Hymenopellis radicata]|nr:WD40 repeat-like protein [Hymenopellis radicata]
MHPRFSSVGHSKGKRRAYYEQDFFRQSLHDSISYSDLPPLDDEEGELIDVDDEACFIPIEYPWGAMAASRARVVTGIGVLYVDNLHALVSCLAVSKTWRHLANDNSVWRAFFTSRWSNTSQLPSSLNFNYLYRQRYELDRRWNALSRAGPPNFTLWEPKRSQLVGHHDSVYCLELCRTSTGEDYIITGSRDRTMKLWRLDTGKCLGTFGSGVVGGEIAGHRGSVLCLKFFWEIEGQKGILYSGSSDATVCIWDLWLIQTSDGDTEVRTKVKAALVGHESGVLDLKVVDNSIITCSKDTIIRIWDRTSLELVRTLRGHEGPVNAVCSEGGKLVSASGDGKLILWDMKSGERLRTLEGHVRGLACIEFKDGLIISGSNDCKIKVWSAATGECLRTLTGHTALVRALAFDPSNGRLASASYDKSVRLWDIGTGESLRQFDNNHTSHIFDVKFDSSRLLSTSHDQSVTVLDFGFGLDGVELFM